jgi:hypothetical protein
LLNRRCKDVISLLGKRRAVGVRGFGRGKAETSLG